MASDAIWKWIAGAARAPEECTLSDALLLERFIHVQDAAAFEAIVRRHGPMVMGVCRRALVNYHDAEDAFQATFLVLARKAESVVPRGMLSNFLYGVAYRTTIKARAAIVRRQSRERQVEQMPEPGTVVPDAAQVKEIQGLLDQELQQLPDRYRLAILLCDLEGLTQKQAAQQLGWREGTLSGRLTRARRILAGRLRGRGLASCDVPLMLASGELSRDLVRSTVEGASRVATSAITPVVAALTEEVLQTMNISKFRVAAMVVLVVSLLGGGVGVTLSAMSPGPADDKPTTKQEGKKAEREESEQVQEKDRPSPARELYLRLKKLERERRDLLKKELERRTQDFEASASAALALQPLIDVSKRLLEAELVMANNSEQHLAAHAARLKLARRIEGKIVTWYKAGRFPEAEYYLAQSYRVDAEIAFLKAGGKDVDEKPVKPKK